MSLIKVFILWTIAIISGPAIAFSEPCPSYPPCPSCSPCPSPPQIQQYTGNLKEVARFTGFPHSDRQRVLVALCNMQTGRITYQAESGGYTDRIEAVTQECLERTEPILFTTSSNSPGNYDLCDKEEGIRITWKEGPLTITVSPQGHCAGKWGR
jgi:hypothetical protein